jgi:hypothetical protein
VAGACPKNNTILILGWSQLTRLHLLDLESSLLDEGGNVASDVASIERPLKKRIGPYLPATDPDARQESMFKKQQLASWFQDPPIPRMASATPGIVHNVNVLTTVSTLASANRIRSPGRPINDVTT